MPGSSFNALRRSSVPSSNIAFTNARTWGTVGIFYHRIGIFFFHTRQIVCANTGKVGAVSLKPPRPGSRCNHPHDDADGNHGESGDGEDGAGDRQLLRRGHHTDAARSSTRKKTSLLRSFLFWAERERSKGKEQGKGREQRREEGEQREQKGGEQREQKTDEHAVRSWVLVLWFVESDLWSVLDAVLGRASNHGGRKRRRSTHRFS